MGVIVNDKIIILNKSHEIKNYYVYKKNSSENRFVFATVFFIDKNIFIYRCRGPPPAINLKKLIDWRRKWIDLKEEKVRTILIL